MLENSYRVLQLSLITFRDDRHVFHLKHEPADLSALGSLITQRIRMRHRLGTLAEERLKGENIFSFRE